MKLPLDPIVLAELADTKPTPDVSILSHFQAVPDFRREHGRRHLLLDILVVAVCATLADCDSFVEMQEYGTDNERWLRSFLELPKGIPSHDTFRRVLGRMAPAPFQRACVSWLLASADKLRLSRQDAAGHSPDNPPAASPPESTTTPLLVQVVGPATANPTLSASATAAEPPTSPRPTSDPVAQNLSFAPPSTLPATERLAEQPSGPMASQPAIEDTQPQQPAKPAAASAAPVRGGALAAPVTPLLSAQAAMTQPVVSSAAGPEGHRRHLAVDGKTSRGSSDKAAGKSALHLVSVWASEERLTLGQVAVAAKSNEITAIPEVLSLLDLEGAIVSIDAMGTQTAIVADIRDRNGDYLLAVKENQPHLYEDVVGSFVRYFEERDGRPDSNEWVVTSKGEHGRQEKRTYVVFDDVSGIRHPEKWRDVKRLIMVLRQCEKSDGTWEEASRYFIGSADSGVATYAKWVRDHWGIENSLHWVLDVIFHEDASRVRKGHGTENLAMLRRLAVSVLGNDKSFKRSLKGKRKKAARNTQYLEHVLLGFSDPDTPLKTQKTAPPA